MNLTQKKAAHDKLLSTLQDKSSQKTKDWWEGYVKDSAPFLGVKMSDIRETLHTWHRNEFKDMDMGEQLDMALYLFEAETTEEKLAGTLFIQEIILPTGVMDVFTDIPRFAELFKKGLIYDWNICDWFCVKVLGPFIKKEGEPCAKEISKWHKASNLWQARASLVAFVPVAANCDYYDLIQHSCKAVISRNERFAKTAVGWILRDISKHSSSFTEKIIENNITEFSRESLNNATKYFPDQKKRYFLELLDNVRR